MRFDLAQRTFVHLTRRLQRLHRDIRGTAAIEFAELAPLLIVMLLGSIEVSRAVALDRRFGMATAMTGDLVARESTVDNTELTAIMGVISFLMQPYNSSSLKASVISVKASPTDANNTKVDWAWSYNGATKPADCSNYSLPTGIISAGGSVVVVETQFSYQPLFLSWVANSMKAATWTDKSTHSPRQNSCVDYKGNNCVSSCTF
jgi:Flp pilus assembly protein TadG